MESVNASIGEQAVFHCLCTGPCLNFYLDWLVNGTIIHKLLPAGQARQTYKEGQGNVTSTWKFTVSPNIAELLNNSNVSCLALPLNHTQMRYDSDPVLLLIQGNQVKEFIQCFTNIHAKLYVCLYETIKDMNS